MSQINVVLRLLIFEGFSHHYTLYLSHYDYYLAALLMGKWLSKLGRTELHYLQFIIYLTASGNI